MEYAIEVQGLTKHYPGFTLDHVSFSVPAGSIVGFIGETEPERVQPLRLCCV